MRTWTREKYSATRFAATRFIIGAWVCALSLGLATQAQASPAQTLPGSVQAPYPGPNTGFQVNLREQQRITGSATVTIINAQLLVNGTVTERFPIGFSGTCVTVGAAPVTLPDATFALRVTIQNGEGSAVGTFPLTNSPAPPIQDRSCSYLNTAPTNVDFEYDIQGYDPELGARVLLTGSASDAENDELTYEWLFEETSRQGQTITANLPEGDTLVILRVRDRGQLSTEIRQTINIPPQGGQVSVELGGTRFVTDTGSPGELVQITPTITGDADPVSFEWVVDDRVVSRERDFSETLQIGEHLVSLNVTFTNEQSAGDDVLVIVSAPEPEPPTANAGEDQTLSDTDGVDGEDVTLDGSQSTGPIEQELTYVWTQNEREIARGVRPTLRFDDGVHDLMLSVSYIVGDGEGQIELVDHDSVQIIVNGAPLAAEGGGNRTVEDSDRAPGERVTLDASASTGPITNYAWTLDGEPIGDGERILADVFVPDGRHTVTLRVSDGEATDTDTFDITVIAPPAVEQQPPTANAGDDQTVADGDGQPGETVTLTGTGTDPDGTIASYEWFLGEESLGTGATLARSLPDGVSVVMLRVTDSSGLAATDTVQITVAAPTLPVVNAGISQTIEDSDVQTGEMVQLSGTATGTIDRYEWFLGDTSLGVGQSIRVRLPDGVNLVTLHATNSVNLTGTASVRITVATGVRTVLSNIPGLTANEKRLAENLDAACNNILGPLTPVETPQTPGETTLLTKGARPPTEAETSDFAQKCRGLLISRDNAQLKDAMGALLGDDFAAARTQTLLFANTQYASVMDRLIALRGGAKGLSLAGLNIMVDGEMIPLAQLQGLAKQLMGGGASSDADGALWSDKWGLWARGNYSFGSKDDDRLSPSFDADQYALLAGLDYRLTETAVIGGALAYGNSSVEFDANEGALDTESWALSLYGSLYAKRNFYFDAIVNVADSGYTAERNITYVDGYGLVNADADGDTGGLTLSGGLSAGYDFLVGGLTISPTLGVFYIDAQIDEFTESNAGGLNLIYDEQQFKSLTGTVGMRATFAWNLPFGVLLPHFRADFVREFEDEVDVFGIRFAADPNAASAPPILVETENPDSSYWRLAAGMSAQFKHGISGYVEYQRLESFRFISFQDVSVGLRFQAAF